MIEIKSKYVGMLDNWMTVYHNYDLYRDYKEWPLHGHDFFELELFLGGKGYQILNGRRHEIEEGSIHLLTTSDFHEMYWESDISQVGIRFDYTKIDKELIKKIYSVGHDIIFKIEGRDYEFIKNLIFIMMDHSDNANGFLTDIFMKSAIETILVLLLKKLLPQKQEKSTGRNYIQNAAIYLEMNFKSNPSLEEVARHVGLNKNYFSEIFSKSTGKSFVRYLADLKLDHSKNLILSSNMSVKEICFSSGFNSFSNFSRAFKLKYGVSPLQYKKTERNT